MFISSVEEELSTFSINFRYSMTSYEKYCYLQLEIKEEKSVPEGFMFKCVGSSTVA